MRNPFIEQARKIVAQAHANANANRLNLARTRCFQFALSACFAAGLSWIGFGVMFLIVGSEIGAATFAGSTILAFFVAWTATLCMSFTARPSLNISG
ncbi:hypothetical protein [uncultured Litoreibacter sp.]|uniref:hypothetical protein n=1 Tax=uncultured Litoreibacter sp. TaxID=1392394 RepID=UPI002611BD3B|nr:hypothetical protein [uncultured Litoreibacter sp.]